jgi:hypothetical protein
MLRLPAALAASRRRAAADKAAAAAAAAKAAAERRTDVRHELPSTEVSILAGGMRFALRLKDLSSRGLCGLTDAPLAPGQTVFLLSGAAEPLPAEIRWIRRALIGAAFADPVPAEVLKAIGLAAPRGRRGRGRDRGGDRRGREGAMR